MVSCSNACCFLAAANCSPRPHASRRPESAVKLSVGDMRYQYVMRCDTVCIWMDTPGAALVSIPCSDCCHGGAGHQMQVDIPGHLCLSLRYLYTPWRLVMRTTLLCRVAHTGPCMEYMRPHMPLKQGAYEHVRIRYVLRVRAVAFAPYIGNPAASLLSSGPTCRQRSAVSYVCTSNGPCWVSSKAGGIQRAKLRCGSVC
ncbi:hypothetical protein M441DRAFT_289096 [Trichoderma asperellum CBS 433.97]|uniref:Uncharacterized protein n=1 Tax=Trichoderma asperellum (strain ATCC 204424 / CBS 433.97 / NBRC 101777) TaxID=1042311 RepID=A0A2T3YTT1_TRIA4|nr:hypothetical protein M441DRAFT_289096 [Trichoderma asperellum CBS 433.97]PTB35947.1 hypothetical protein M441DRAFT_289096 [Trichoderma asperellum CBS 433.97]